MKKNKSDTEQMARYIKVPLPMIRLMIKDKRKIKDVIAYGVYLTAMGQRLSVENALLQVIYAYYNQGSQNERVAIPSSLLGHLQEIDDLVGLTDEDYRGFDGLEFNPLCSDGNYATVHLREWCVNFKDIAEDVAEFHAIRQVAKFFNFSWIDVNGVRKIHEKYKQFDHETFAYANLDIMMKYNNDIEQKNEDDMSCLFMYLAYKSIIGDKQIVRASNSMVLARMVGAKGRDEVEIILEKHDHAKRFYGRYSQKENFNRIKNMVCKYKFIPRIQSIPGKAGLGTFVSCDRNISDKKFAKLVFNLIDDERKRKNRERVARYRAKYRLEAGDTGKYLAGLFSGATLSDGAEGIDGEDGDTA